MDRRREGEERFHAIRNYVDAAAAVRSLKHPQTQFGEVIAASPMRRDTWAKFVVASTSSHRISRDFLSEVLRTCRSNNRLCPFSLPKHATSSRKAHGCTYFCIAMAPCKMLTKLLTNFRFFK
jgi:hypothetical protein